MPIGGVVITTRPGDLEAVREHLAGLAGLEIHGADERGTLVAVFDTGSSEEMERLLQTVNACPLVLHVGLTYLNMEDVVADGETDEPPHDISHDGAGE